MQQIKIYGFCVLSVIFVTTQSAAMSNQLINCHPAGIKALRNLRRSNQNPTGEQKSLSKTSQVLCKTVGTQTPPEAKFFLPVNILPPITQPTSKASLPKENTDKTDFFNMIRIIQNKLYPKLNPYRQFICKAGNASYLLSEYFNHEESIRNTPVFNKKKLPEHLKILRSKLRKLENSQLPGKAFIRWPEYENLKEWMKMQIDDR